MHKSLLTIAYRKIEAILDSEKERTPEEMQKLVLEAREFLSAIKNLVDERSKVKLFSRDDGNNMGDFTIKATYTAEDVKNAPTMAEVWPKIRKLYQPGMLVAAHNARFDCRVMEKSLARYNIPAPHYFAIDTLATSTAFEPDLPNHKLDTVSDALNINLWHHHNALSDSEACAGILIEENKRVGDDPIKKMVKPI